MAGFDNSNVFADNVDFSGGFPVSGKVVADGQLLIGATATPNIRVNTLTSSGGTVAITNGPGTINLETVGGAGTLITLTPDEDFDGTAATPISGVGGNINISGARTAASPITETYNSTGGVTGNLEVEHRAWTTAFVVDASVTPGARGTFSTIASAIAAASAGTTIFIRPGTYTENLTLKVGVNLTAYQADFRDSVTIIGKVTFTLAGIVVLTGIKLRTNSDYLVEVTGSAASNLFLKNCYLDCTNFSGIHITSSGSAGVFVRESETNLTTTGIALFVSTGNGILAFDNSVLNNTGNSTTASTCTAGILNFNYCVMSIVVTTSSTSVIGSVQHCAWNTAGPNTTALTHGAGSIYSVNYSLLTSGNQPVISVGTGATIEAQFVDINSTSSTPVTGLGTFRSSSINFIQNSVVNATTQIPRTISNDAVKVTTPGAYPYTAIPQDYVILVDTSSARTINLNASPVTGQTYRIKDNVGSAAANIITITPAAGNIDGAGSTTITVNYGSVDVCYNGTQWNIL